MSSESQPDGVDLAQWLKPVRSDSPDADVLAEQRLQLLRWCITQLRNEAHVELLVLRYEHGWTFAQIAAHRGTVESAAYQLHTRILGRLRSHLEAAGIRTLRDIL